MADDRFYSKKNNRPHHAARVMRSILKRVPRQDQLKNTWLYRVVGERLFNADLWRPSRKRVAAGLALGIFVGLTPTMGVQMIISGISATILRANIPASLAGCWITNPLTAPVIYTLQYQLGVCVLGKQCLPHVTLSTGVMENIVRYAKPLWFGSLITAVICTPIVYVLVFVGWSKIEEAFRRQDKDTHNREDLHD